MNRPDNQSYPSAQSAQDTYRDIAGLSKKLITEMLVRMIESAEDYHSWSLSDEDGARLVKLVKRKQRMICSSYSFQLRKNFANFEAGGEDASAQSNERGWQNLGLGGDSETEELQNISKRYGEAFREFDKTILKRLQHCVRRSRAHIQDNPLQVRRLCEAFQYSIDSLNLEPSCKLALYNLFADRFIEALGPFYRRIDRELIQQGMVEDLSPARIHLRNADGLSESRPPQALSLKATATQLVLLQQFKEYSLEQSRPQSNLLGELKQQFIRHGLVDNTDKIDQLNVILTLIFEDEDLPEAVKQQISRLQIFILITALQEDSFFKQSGNPARRLLNAIVGNEAEIARSGAAKKSGVDFLRKQIDKLASSELISLDSFREILEGYQKLGADNETEKLNAKRAEAVRKLMPTIKARLAELTRPLKDQGRPTILFDRVWLPLLLQIAMKQGMKSDTWKKTMATVKAQVWSLTPKTSAQDQAQLQAILPKISHSLQRAMRSLKLPEKLQQSLQDFLKLEQQDVLDKSMRAQKESQRKTRSLSARSFDSKETDEFSAMMETGVFQVTPEMLAALNGVKPAPAAKPKPGIIKGDWVQVRQAGQSVLAKLAWKSDDDSLFIFIDRDGKRVCEVDDETLSRRLDSGDISPVNKATVSSEKTQFSIMRSL